MTNGPIAEARRLAPSRWRWIPLKRAAGLNARTLPEDTNGDFTFRYIDIGSVHSDGSLGELDEVTFGQAPSRARRIVRSGDVLVSTVRTYLRAIARVSEANGPLVCSTGFVVLSATGDIDGDFMSWWVRSTPFVEEVVARSVGVGYPAISPTELSILPTPVPSRPEQRRIASFLDRETARIDQTTARRRRELSLVGTRSTVATFLAATGAASPGERRASGLRWVDQLPAHWRVVPLRYFARLGSGHTPSRSTPAYWENCTIPWISLFDVGKMRNPFQENVTETAQKISELGLANSSAELHPAGTVVLSRTASVGFATLMGSTMAVSQHFVTWTCSEAILPAYLLYLLRAMHQEWEALQVGTTNVTVFMPDLMAIRIPLPPLPEQRAIVAEIRRSVARASRLVSSISLQVRQLEERRQALITATVTGQIELPGRVA